MKALVTISLSCAIFIILCALCLSDNEVRDWLKFHLFYRDYLAWKEQGGPIEPQFYEPLFLDRHSDEMVKGLSYDQIRKKFPFLVDGARFSENSYKGEYNRDPKTKVLWFKKEDGFDWCVRVDASGATIILIKG